MELLALPLILSLVVNVNVEKEPKVKESTYALLLNSHYLPVPSKLLWLFAVQVLKLEVLLLTVLGKKVKMILLMLLLVCSEYHAEVLVYGKNIHPSLLFFLTL